MLTIRGVYDGKTFKVLPTEPLPEVQHEIPVAIIFLEDIAIETQRHQHQIEIAERMRAAREAMPLLDITVKDLVEEGRER
jgi:hypothetical protein